MIRHLLGRIAARKIVQEAAGLPADDYVTEEYLEELHNEMLAAAANLEFERRRSCATGSAS
jgi:hypothetical protein